jgi:hypothetical protein
VARRFTRPAVILSDIRSGMRQRRVVRHSDFTARDDADGAPIGFILSFDLDAGAHSSAS